MSSDEIYDADAIIEQTPDVEKVEKVQSCGVSFNTEDTSSGSPGKDDFDNEDNEGSSNPIYNYFSGPQNRGKRYIGYYFTWVLLGTLCFAYAPWSHTSGFIMGYYSAINVGYSIGWAYPPQPDGPELLFSSAFLLFGAGFVSMALGAFADNAMQSRDTWFTKMVKQAEFEEAFSKSGNGRFGFFLKCKLFYNNYRDTIFPICLWLTLLVLMMLNGRYVVNFSWPTTQYYALTSCSTGGMVGMEDAPLWSFFLHAFLTSMAVPAMAWAMGAIGMLSNTQSQKELDDTKKRIKDPVTPEELEFLRDLGLEDGDGQIDKAEFIILSMARMGIDVQLLNFISERFEKLDNDHSGSLSIYEVTKGQFYLDESGRILQSSRDI